MENKEVIETYKEKIEEQRRQIKSLHDKIERIEKDKPTIRKDLLGLIPGQLYLLITDGRRIVGKLEFESKSFICYSKRENEKYYANKSNIKLIKEMSLREQISYRKSNFNETDEEE